MIDRPAQRRALLWSAITAVLMVVSLFGIFFVAPTDGDQGIIQKIFYFHVADAMAALIIFAVAAVSAILYLRTRKERYDEITTVSIGVGLVYSILVVITGSIWAKASWGTYWVWNDPRLVTFLILLLLYASYFVLRSSVEGERRLRYSAIFALIAFASVPLSFYSVRVARSFVHPVVITNSGANMPTSMLVWFLVSMAAFLALFVAVLQFELVQMRVGKALQKLKLQLEGD